MKTFRRGLAVIAVLAIAAVATPSDAVVTATWTVDSYQQFDKGDATSAFITSLGEVKPGWDTKRTELQGTGVWSAVRLADGTILVGTDDNGAVYKVTGDGSKKLATIDGAIAVVALTQAPDGAVYAGAMPGDTIWKLDLAGGKPTAYASMKGVETVWSLAATGDAVWAGTGPDGKLYKATKGTAKEAFATEDKRVTALAVTGDGAVWMGTSERALVFRLDARTGKTRAMADFAGNEITALAPMRGGVVVAANELSEVPTPGTKTATATQDSDKPGQPKGQAPKLPDVGSAPGADKDNSATELGRKGARKGKGALFRVADDGRLEQLHALTQTYFTSIAVDPDGAVYAGAADKGRVYLVDTDDSVATAFDVDERAVSQLFWDGAPGKKLAFCTDDGAALYRATGKASKANYVSEVYDAKSPSRFGRLTWKATGKVVLETRSGNTAKPGPGWSEWEKPAGVGKLGGGTVGGKVASPPGRYVQFRISFGGDDASVRQVSTYYVPQNTATEVTDVEVELATTEATPTLKDTAARPRTPTVRIKWKADNGDGDATSYALAVRRDGEADWRPLSTGKTPLTATQWEWNTEAVPDGWYRVRVTSTDAAANSPDRALTSTSTSALFAIDNTRPAIDDLRVQYPKATAKASDAINVITEMSFSVDDGPWQLGTTGDGIFDDLSETLVVEMPADLTKGTHTLAIRVADANGNVGATSTTFVVK
ncbi:MAG: hypothetical protein H6709_17075 [Kofleriaceae bacterium]|nr:hypothetical protein [Myxococcales bacterium]MCB9565034.1 hypothetical protein [Kofleriaceae bacterium]MCB9573795.1 hypothetical protein [Kofleriaceae bacterium]